MCMLPCGAALPRPAGPAAERRAQRYLLVDGVAMKLGLCDPSERSALPRGLEPVAAVADFLRLMRRCVPVARRGRQIADFSGW